MDDKSNLSFLFSGDVVDEKNIMDILEGVRKDKEAELKKSSSEISALYESIEEVDNKIKDRKNQIKNMEIKIREVKDAATNIFTAMRYLAVTRENSILNRIKRVFRKEQLKLNA